MWSPEVVIALFKTWRRAPVCAWTEGHKLITEDSNFVHLCSGYNCDTTANRFDSRTTSVRAFNGVARASHGRGALVARRRTNRSQSRLSCNRCITVYKRKTRSPISRSANKETINVTTGMHGLGTKCAVSVERMAVCRTISKLNFTHVTCTIISAETGENGGHNNLVGDNIAHAPRHFAGLSHVSVHMHDNAWFIMYNIQFFPVVIPPDPRRPVPHLVPAQVAGGKHPQARTQIFCSSPQCWTQIAPMCTVKSHDKCTRCVTRCWLPSRVPDHAHANIHYSWLRRSTYIRQPQLIYVDNGHSFILRVLATSNCRP